MRGDQVPEFSSATWTYIVVGLVVLFGLGVFARVRDLMRISKEIEAKLDYSKMKEWEDEDDWGKPEGSLVDGQRSPAEGNKKDTDD